MTSGVFEVIDNARRMSRPAPSAPGPARTSFLEMGPSILVPPLKVDSWGPIRADRHMHQVHLLLFLEGPEPLPELLHAYQVQDVLQVHAAPEPAFERVQKSAPLLFEEDVHGSGKKERRADCSPFKGRDDWTRTSDHTSPRRVLYQLSYIPSSPKRSAKIATFRSEQQGVPP